MTKIIQVDDRANAKNELAEFLDGIGVSNYDIQFCSVEQTAKQNWLSRLLEKLPQKDAWNDVALVMLDLELFRASHTRVTESDLAGLALLPEIRKRAPWVPIVVYSHLLDYDTTQSVLALPLVTTAGADACLSKSYIYGSHSDRVAITKADWEQLLRRAKLNRLRAVTGNFQQSSQHRLNVARSFESEMTKVLGGEWREVCEQIFPFARKVVIEEFYSGRSGAVGAKVTTQSDDALGACSGVWFLKLSRNLFKLQLEADAHQSVIWSGWNFGQMVPTLWRQIIVSGSVGGLAYHLAEDFSEAARALAEPKKQNLLMNALSTALVAFYRDARNDREILETILQRWFSPSQMELIERALSDKRTNEAGLSLTRSVQIAKARLHGDLHFSNILVTEDLKRTVLIDFARSADGPIVLDLAKLYSDLLLRGPELSIAELPSMREAGLGRLMPSIYAAIKFTADDESLFKVCLRAYLTQAMTFPDVQDGRKAGIRDLLK